MPVLCRHHEQHVTGSMFAVFVTLMQVPSPACAACTHKEERTWVPNNVASNGESLLLPTRQAPKAQARGVCASNLCSEKCTNCQRAWMGLQPFRQC